MTEFYERVGIFHQKSVPRTPQQNNIVERRNHTLVEAARTMLIFSKAPMFLWAEAVATACYTQNISLIHTRHNKTPYELVHDKKPDLSFLRVFGALCYPTNDSEDLVKLQPNADIGIFVFTISANVPKILMQQFWYTIKKLEGSESYEFLLANIKCVIDADVFREILDICPRIEGTLHKHTNTFVDHMHQPWRTLAACINKCLSGKTIGNDKLRKREKKSRRENMPYPRFTKVIIDYFLSKHKSLKKLKFQHFHTIKDDGVVSRLKFVRIGKDVQQYGLAIPATMLNNDIIQSESYKMFIMYSTGQIPPKKSRGKVSQGKKIADITKETVDVSEESDPEPLVRKKTSSRRTVKKKPTILAADNIVPDPDLALELGKSISLTEAEEEALIPIVLCSKWWYDGCRSGGERKWWWHLQGSDGGRRDEAILHILCILDGFFNVVGESVELAKFI
ncbi:retrovirus-related pol polyprotein from transposon TNT 1-94 [Tanacetum coccineum]